MMIKPHDVKMLTGVKPQNFRLQKEDEDGLNHLLTKWISQSENLITTYCNNNFTNGVPAAVSNVCLRLTANMVAFAQTRKDTPVIKADDFTQQFSSSNIFTKDLKEDLEPFRRERKSRKADPVDIFCIHG